jgi:hypothetical protein
MTYYQANTDSEEIICDSCGDTRWAEHPRYGSNVDSRLAEAEMTGIRWSWVPRYSSTPTPCSSCGEAVK